MCVCWFKPYPLQDALCRSMIVGAADIVEAQEHTFVRCWFKGTIILTVPLPLRPTEAVDMVETQREFSRAHEYWFKNTASFFYRDAFSFAAPRERELSTWSKRSHVNTLFESADSKFHDRRRYRYCQTICVRWFKAYPLQDALCRSVIVGAVEIVEAQKHIFVRC